MKKVKYSSRRNSEKKSGKKGNWINRVLDSGIGQIVLLVISAFLLITVYRSFKQMGQKISLLKQAQQEVGELRLENLELSLRIEDAGSIENLEKEARDRLNYGKENEVVFVIDERLMQIGREKVQAILNPKEEIPQPEIFNDWVDFIVKGY